MPNRQTSARTAITLTWTIHSLSMRESEDGFSSLGIIIDIIQSCCQQLVKGVDLPNQYSIRLPKKGRSC